ncbi:hypothetical protein CDL12_27029 [Handroanthus impetiginosus]|uniref:Uncharacterized protein n=1 Tax=Handroanthus impetiginosus TaxID=429701 RepID=A0A2G9G594_9LAMI|nr:hypothetical protein CDL12_27029 [Handroanthus impetiginosus]
MLNSLRALRAQPSHLARQASRVRFAQAVSGPSQPDTSEKMEQKEEQEINSGRKTKSLPGGGYATRSDEQGYGAVHGGNQSIPDEDEDKIIHGNAPGKYNMIAAKRVREVNENRRDQNDSWLASLIDNILRLFVSDLASVMGQFTSERWVLCLVQIL